MITADTIAAVNQSYGRCSLDAGFFDAFYDTFFKSSDRIAPMFKNTDFNRQKDVLKNTVAFVIMYAKDASGAFALNKLKYVGDIHSRGKLNVTPDLYPFWIESLIKTLQARDPQFNPQLEKQWREVLHPAIELLKSLY